ncbi:MAG: hypothetical protein NTY09_11210 [bacterium]|nr:hypothetical protein [bacterium]
MFLTERIIASVSIIWAISALIYQWIKARGKGRIDYSVQAGNPIRGIIYNFTWAMLPSHKETISRHPVWFSIGLLMHIGIFIAIVQVIIDILIPKQYMVPIPLFPNPIHDVIITGLFFILAIASLCAAVLFLKRVFSKTLRYMSSFDDYFSILLVLDFLLAASFRELRIFQWGPFFIHSAILFFYLPLGKLRHALFFFIARAEYGSRLGYRGTYPAKSGVKE